MKRVINLLEYELSKIEMKIATEVKGEGAYKKYMEEKRDVYKRAISILKKSE